MKQISAIIERASDGTYSVYCKNEIFSGMGDTIEEAKADICFSRWKSIRLRPKRKVSNIRSSWMVNSLSLTP